MRYILFFLLINVTRGLAQVPPPINPGDYSDYTDIPAPPHPTKLKIDSLYKDWKNESIAKGAFLAIDSCNFNYVTQNDIDPLSIFGIPDDVGVSYSDVNKDKTLDALYFFTPQQCDGGNASMFFQVAVLFVSDEDKYKITTYMPSTSTLSDRKIDFLYLC